MIHLFTGSEHQLAAQAINGVARIYAEAQEFGSPGNPFNQGGAHMFGQAEAEDLDVIAGFGLNGLEVGIADIVSGRGYRL